MHPAATLITLFLAAALAAPPARAAAAEEWEYTMSLDAPGAAVSMGMARVCRTTASSLKPRLPANCTLDEYGTSGNKAHFRAVCGPPQPSTMSGEMVRTGDTLAGTLRMQQGGQDLLLKQTARRLGPCSNPVD